MSEKARHSDVDSSVRSQAIARLADRGYVFLSATEVGACVQKDMAAGADLPTGIAQLVALAPSWNDLPRDQYLRDGGTYRSRRHSCFIQQLSAKAQPVMQPRTLSPTPHRAHWQPTSYNALHGGLERWFEPISPQVADTAVWSRLLSSIGSLFAEIHPVDRWFIEAHQFRIDTSGGIGRPTPEGAHRDGVDFVALLLVQRLDVRGGETRVFDANGPSGFRFTMQEPWSALLMDDARVIHETTPIQPDGAQGVRDTLVLTYRAKGFQSPEET